MHLPARPMTIGSRRLFQNHSQCKRRAGEIEFPHARGDPMQLRRLLLIFALAILSTITASGQTPQPPTPLNGGDFSSVTQPLTKVPTGVILIKGAWSSASDSVTPVPEGATVTDNVFRSEYFGASLSLPSGWNQKHEGPPPSDSGRYVLAQLRPADASPGHTQAT